MLVAISAMHNRHALSRAWAEHTGDVDIRKVCVCITEGDTESAMICKDEGIHYCFAPNQPLGAKFNAALSMAMELTRWDENARFMILPSDDFPSQAWVDAANTSDEPYMFPHTCAILDSETQAAYKIRKLGLNDGAQVGTLRFGAGRVISRKVIEKLNGQLWPEHLAKGLDTASHNAIIRAGFKPKVVDTGSIPITDVKTKENLWPFQAWIGSGDTIKADEALHMCSPSVRAQIDALKS